jgi:release factor glutamine methyltransferase
VLIPRADTEHLVDFAVRNIPSGELFIDLCTGSGCVAISTLKNTKNTSALAVDISPDALKVAAENAEANGVSERLTLIEGDAMSEDWLPNTRPFAILSNPPYVSEAAYAALEPEIYREPKCAFVGGSDGGDFYRAIIPMAARVIKDEGFAALEIGYDQAELIRSIAGECGLCSEIIKDYSGLDRVAVIRKNR